MNKAERQRREQLIRKYCIPTPESAWNETYHDQRRAGMSIPAALADYMILAMCNDMITALRTAANQWSKYKRDRSKGETE